MTGSSPPISRRSEPVPPPPPRPNPPLFWRIRLGCQGGKSPAGSGNASGSPASLKASTARIADAVWWPWPPALRREPGDDHVGPERADHPHDVGNDGLAIPDRERLGGVLREAEVDGAGEELPAAVEAAGGEQLLGADHAQLFEELRADHVLAAVAPGEREIGCAVAAAARKVGDELGVFVVGVRGHVQDAPQLAKPAQRPQSVLGRHRFRGAAAGDRPGKQGPGQDEGNKPGDGPVRPVEASWCAHGGPRSWEVHRGRDCGGRDGNRRRPAAFRPHFFTVKATEYCVFSHCIFSTPPPLASARSPS